MGDCVKRLDEDREGRSRVSMHPYQSVWMTHWKQTSCDAAVQVSKGVGYSEKIYDIRNHHPINQTEFAPEVARSPKQLGETKTWRFEISNESARARDLRYEEKRCESSPVVAGACRSGHRSLKPLIGSDIEIGKVTTMATSTSCIPFSAAADVSSREFRSQPESNSWKPTDVVKTHAFFRESSFRVTEPLHENFPGSASDIVSNKSNYGNIRSGSGRRAIMEAPHLSSNNHLLSSNLRLSDTDDSYFSLSRQLINNHKNLENSLTPYFRENITTLLPDDPSTSDPPEIGGEHLKLQNFSGFRQSQLPHHRHTPEKLNHAYYSQQKLPHSVLDVESMRMCTNVDSVVGLSGGFPRFSQTTRSFLITKKTNGSLGKGKEVINNFGNAYLDLQTPSPFFRSGQQGVKIRSLDSSADSEGKENTEDNVASKAILKNESSADTAIMDMDAFKERDCVSGVNASPLNKVLPPLTLFEGVEMDSKPSKFPIDSSGRHERSNTMLPDMNLEFRALSPEENSTDNAEPSSSKTQSLDMDLLLKHAEPTNYDNSLAEPTNNDNSHAELTNYDNSHAEPTNPLKPDPTERWIKRLKVSTSDSLGLGMKISNLEDFSHKEATISEPKEENSHADGLTEQDMSKTLSRNREFLSVGTGKRSKDLLLSQAWIQRWLHSDRTGTPPKDNEAVLLNEPQSSKLASDDFQQKNFPSIAAMALLGKAMNGFQPCQIEKKGSFVFWSTKEV